MEDGNRASARDTGRAMSQENVEAMRHAIEVWNRDDLDAYLQLVEELVHPEIEWYAVIAQLVEGQDTVYRGRSGMRRFWEDWHDVFDFRFDETEIRDLGDKLIVLSHASVTGRRSGIDLDTPLAMIVTFEGGRIIRTRSYLDHAEALEAAGLRS
jgi:ketosteroid isomerase-like protein